MTVKHRLVVAAVSAALTGCAVGPDYHAPKVQVPDHFGAATQPSTTQPATTQPAMAPTPVDLTRWWNSFQDPALTQLINKAVESNLDVQLATARVREARALLEQNTATLFPTLDGAAAYSRSRQSKNAFSFSPAATSGSATGT